MVPSFSAVSPLFAVLPCSEAAATADTIVALQHSLEPGPAENEPLHAIAVTAVVAALVASSLPQLLSLPAAVADPATAQRLAAACAIVVNYCLPAEARRRNLVAPAGMLFALLGQAFRDVLFKALSLEGPPGQALRTVLCRRGVLSGFLRQAMECMESAQGPGAVGEAAANAYVSRSALAALELWHVLVGWLAAGWRLHLCLRACIAYPSSACALAEGSPRHLRAIVCRQRLGDAWEAYPGLNSDELLAGFD